MSPIGSYVGGLTSKGQVGVLLGEHRGWMLHMAFSYKAKYCVQQHFSLVKTYSILLSTQQTAVAVCRLSDSSDGQTSDGAHKHAFPYSYIAESTIHQPQAGPPFSPERSFVLQAFLFLAFVFLSFIRKNSSSLLQSYWIARSRESNMDSCWPMSFGSYRPANPRRICTDSEQSSRPDGLL